MSKTSVTERIVARDVFSGEVVAVTLQEDIVVSVERGIPIGQMPKADELPWITPGFCDIQVNGFAGHDFTSPHVSLEDVWAAAKALFRTGVTCFLPTITTQSYEILENAVRTIAQAVNEYPPLAQAVLGIHLEGPYISAEDGPRGAHPREHVRPPDWEEFCRLQDAATGLIRLVTLSPEYPAALPFIEQAVASGVVVAIGHTAASSQQLSDAVSAGAQLSTHLGNGCHLMLPRHPNYIWQQLADDRLWASFIFDGHHLPRDFMIVALRAKGTSRAILVSDMTALAGMPPGLYQTPLGDVELLPEGRLVVAGQRQLLAGAAQPIIAGIINAIAMAGLTTAEALRMATVNPRALLGLPALTLQPGTRAEFVLLRLDQKRLEAHARSWEPKRAAAFFQDGAVQIAGESVARIEKVYLAKERYSLG